MAWSGGTYTRTNGTYTGATVWAQDAAAGVKILSTRHDTHDQDLATGINSCLNKDGSNAPSTGIKSKYGFTPGTIYNAGASPASIDWANGFVQYATFNANYGTPLTFANMNAGVQYYLFLSNTDSSNHTVSIGNGGGGGLSGITVNANTMTRFGLMKVGNLQFVYADMNGSNSGFSGP